MGNWDREKGFLILFFFYFVPAALKDFKISQVSTVCVVGKEKGNKASLSP